MPTKPVIELSKHVSAPLITTQSLQRVGRALRHLITVPKSWCQVSVVVVGDAEMKQLNQQHRQQSVVTDVLSFPYGKDGGEIVLCYPQAKRQARQKQVSLRSELAWLLIHGFLHLLGFDHETAAETKQMRSLEQKILLYV